jgi:hypothetical protein
MRAKAKSPMEIHEVPVGLFGVILRHGSSRRYATHFVNANKLRLFRPFHTFLNFRHGRLLQKMSK